MKNRKPLFVLINDIHINKDNCDLVYNIFEQLVDVCKKYDVRNVVMGGDLFTNRSGQPLNVLLSCLKCINLLQDNRIELYMIPGNHDKTDCDSDDSYLDIFRNCDMVNVIRRRKIITINDCDLYFIPYYGKDVWLSNFNKLVKNRVLDKADSKRKRILITHVAIDGVKNNDGSLVSGEISNGIFNFFDNVFVGHYHNASDVGKNIHYTGSAYQKDYGENITDKGFAVVYDDASWIRVNSVFPRYIKELVNAANIQELRNLLEKYEGTDDNVRLVISGSKLDCEKINVNDIRVRYGVDVKVQTDEEVEAMEISHKSTIRFDKLSIKKNFIRFCSENEIKGDKFKFGLNLIKSI